MFYFKDPRCSVDRLDPEQFLLVSGFKKRLLTQGIVQDFETTEQFKTMLLKHLAVAVDGIRSNQFAPKGKALPVSKKTEDIPVELDDKNGSSSLGFFDLVDVIEDRFDELTATATELTDAMTTLSTAIEKRTADLSEDVPEQTRAGRQKISRHFDQIANDISNYAMKVNDLVPRLELSFVPALEEMQVLVVVAVEDGFADQEQTAEIQLSMRDMRDVFISLQPQISGFLTTIEATPRLNKSVRQAKHRAVLATGRLLKFIENGSLLIDEVLKNVSE